MEAAATTADDLAAECKVCISRICCYETSIHSLAWIPEGAFFCILMGVTL